MDDRDLKPVLERQLLLQLGDRLRLLRKAKGWSATDLAARAGLTRNTLRSIESGDPSPSIGNYLHVMSLLGVAADLALWAGDALQTAPADSAAARSHRVAPTVKIQIKMDEAVHRSQDLQSLALHEAAVDQVKRDPECLIQAQETLMRWRLKSDSRTDALWHEWESILQHQSWRKVLGRTWHAQQLRQASPLVTVLPDHVRHRILSQVKALKQGVVMGGPLTHIEHDGGRATHDQARVGAHHPRQR